MSSRKIAVLGGGHGARTTAADMALLGHDVTLFEFERFHVNVAEIFKGRTISISGKVREGKAKLALCTHHIAQAVRDVDLILIIVPSLYHRDYAEALAPVLKSGQHVVLIPGTFGSLEFMTIIRQKGCTAEITVSEVDTLPYATRITGPASVNVYHALPVFGMGVFPADRTGEVLSLFKDLYPTVNSFRDVLEAGLSNCNPVIHPLGVLLNAGRIEYARGEFWYYEEGVTPSVARATEALDRERMEIGAKLGLNLPDQATALHAVGYGPKGDLWEVLKASKGLTPIKGPTSLTNRYVTEDIPIGLVCWCELGEQLGVTTPLMRATIAIGSAISGVDYWKTGRTIERCGIKLMSAEEIVYYAKTGKKRRQTFGPT
jgi:opine dehydrogenase